MRFIDDDGKLKDYDTSLVRTEEAIGDYMYETAESDKMSYFPEKISEETPVLTEYDRYEVGIHSDVNRKDTNKSEKGKIDTEKVTDLYANQEEKKVSIKYGGIWKSTRLEYESTNDGLKESIILTDASAPFKYTFVITTKNCCIVTQKQLMQDGVEAKKNIKTGEGESLYLYDMETKKLVGSLPAGYMMDMTGDYSEGCSYSLRLKTEEKSETDTKYSYEMVLTANKEYLQSAERKYPVTIDPSITWTSKAAQTSSAYVCKSSPNSTYTDENTNILCVGKRNTSSSVCRSYIKFEGVNAALADMYVDRATLTLNTTQANTGMSVYVRNVCSSWNAGTITYNSQPKKIEGVLGSFKTTKSGEKIQVSLDANMLYNYVRNEESLYGVELTDSNDDSNISSTKTVWIYNSLSMNNTKIPKLEVEYYDVDETTTPQLKYQVYRKGAGWSTWEEDGETAGDLNESRKLRALKMDFEANGFNVGTVKYRAYFENSGWTDWKSEGESVGNINSDENMKTVEMKVLSGNNLSGQSIYYSVYYRTYIKNRGWIGWAKNGETAGDYSNGSCVEGIQAVVVPVLRHKRWYSLNGENDVGYFFDINFDQAVGEKSKLYGIASIFYDPKLAVKNKLKIVTYTQNGSVDSGSTEKEFSFYGGTEENYITGYTIEAENKDLAAKYDAEHVASATDPMVMEESWAKNENISGTKTKEGALEMFCARLVPKDYVEGERACYSDRFLVQEDGYSFDNRNTSFEYDDDYRIPQEKYIAIYGETEGKNIFKNSKEWAGSCFGMCLSALLFYNEYWEPREFASGIDKGAQSAGRLYIQQNRKSRSLTNLIEYCQISWGLQGQGEDYVSTLKNYPQIIELLQEMNGKSSYIMIMSSDEGDHAVIPLDIQHIGGEKYEIQMYDVNAPRVISRAIIDNNSFSYGNFYDARLLNIDQWMDDKEEIYQQIQELVVGKE